MLHEKFFRHTRMIGLSAILAAGLAAPGYSQTSTTGTTGTAAATQANDHDITRGELDRFDDFLDKHPKINSEVRKDPSLLTNQDYLSKHPELGEFLQNHPGVREEVKENPQQFMNRERKFERSGNDIDRSQLRAADNFFDKHKDIAQDLKKNPSLVDNKDYLEDHPALRDFLEDHPRVRADIKSHPNAFMKREGQFEKHEGPEHPRKRGK